MARRPFDDHDRHTLGDAVAYVESVSAVELVVVMRPAAPAWPHAGWLAGVAAAWAVLALLLFSPPAFRLWSFLLDPVLAGGVIGWLVHRFPGTARWITPRDTRRRLVQKAAEHAFLSRRVHDTRSRTGVLVYAAIADGLVTVIGDTGVLDVVTAGRLDGWRVRIEAALPQGPRAIAAALAAMAPVFAAALPRCHDDRNELPNLVDVLPADGADA